MKVHKASLMSDCFIEASHTPDAAHTVLASRLDLSRVQTVGRKALKGESGLVLTVTPAAHTICRCFTVTSFSRQTQEVMFSCLIPVTWQHVIEYVTCFLICRFIVSSLQFFHKQLSNSSTIFKIIGLEKTYFPTQWRNIRENTAEFLNPLLLN